jgi:hypothetical protein
MACRTRRPVGTYGETIGSSSPSPPSRTGWRPGGKKAETRIDGDYLDWALDGFSGYIAADELYDGPYCVLSIVDNRAFRRISYRVLDHDPTQDDIRESFSAYRVRTQEHIHERIATDMLRDAQAPARCDTTRTLHRARAG